MSYAVAAALQAAIYRALQDDAALTEAVGAAVFDAEPDAPPDLYVALGPERVRAVRDTSGSGAVHRLAVSVVTTREGFSAIKSVAGRVADVLEGGLSLARGRLVDLTFLQARAVRDRTGRTRRVDLTFRARTDDEGDGT